jgi:hypothetical protein
MIGWEETKSNCHFFHGAKISLPKSPPGFGQNVEEMRLLYLRLVCHLMVDKIPDFGLPEVFESLQEFQKYYQSFELAPVRHLPQTSRSAKLGERTERGPFFVEGE